MTFVNEHILHTTQIRMYTYMFMYCRQIVPRQVYTYRCSVGGRWWGHQRDCQYVYDCIYIHTCTYSCLYMYAHSCLSLSICLSHFLSSCRARRLQIYGQVAICYGVQGSVCVCIDIVPYFIPLSSCLCICCTDVSILASLECACYIYLQ